jgi:Mn-containing catalase
LSGRNNLEENNPPANPPQNNPPNPPQNNPTNPPQNSPERPPNEENELQLPPPIQRPPPGACKNLFNQIGNQKTELEALIRRLKNSVHSNPQRAQLVESLESILTHVGSVSGQLHIWHNKREEQKHYYANKLSYEDVKKNKLQKVTYAHCLKNQVKLTQSELQPRDSQFIGASMMI